MSTQSKNSSAARGAASVATAIFFAWCSPLAAQSPDMNLFLALEGPSRGADRPALQVSDEHCHDLAYAQGYGHLR